ncbi:MAG: hypothetical protein ABI240_12520 [Sphingomonas sp.]
MLCSRGRLSCAEPGSIFAGVDDGMNAAHRGAFAMCIVAIPALAAIAAVRSRATRMSARRSAAFFESARYPSSSLERPEGQRTTIAVLSLLMANNSESTGRILFFRPFWPLFGRFCGTFIYIYQ